ncbi:MAG: MFS transporter, partial [Acidimicrobiales bacterium]
MAYLLFVTLLGNNGPGSLYVVYRHRFGFSAAVLTAVFATYSLTVLVTLLGIGRVSDRVGRRPVILFSLAVLGVAAAVFAGASSVAWLFAGRFLQGVATGTLLGAGTAAMVELEPRRDERRASLFTTVSFMSGAAVGPLVFGALAQYGPWPIVLPYLVVLALLAAALPGTGRLPETVPTDPKATGSPTPARSERRPPEPAARPPDPSGGPTDAAGGG